MLRIQPVTLLKLLKVGTILALMTTGCAGLSDQIIDKAEKGTVALKEAADVIEFARCEFRTVGVLSNMIKERGDAWAAGYALSCPNLQPIIDMAKKVPSITVQ